MKKNLFIILITFTALFSKEKSLEVKNRELLKENEILKSKITTLEKQLIDDKNRNLVDNINVSSQVDQFYNNSFERLMNLLYGMGGILIVMVPVIGWYVKRSEDKSFKEIKRDVEDRLSDSLLKHDKDIDERINEIDNKLVDMKTARDDVYKSVDEIETKLTEKMRDSSIFLNSRMVDVYYATATDKVSDFPVLPLYTFANIMQIKDKEANREYIYDLYKKVLTCFENIDKEDFLRLRKLIGDNLEYVRENDGESIYYKTIKSKINELDRAYCK